MTKMVVDFEINRVYLRDCVQGVLETKSGFRCVTLERPWLDNEQSISCIPEGTYTYFYRDSPTNGPVLELENVVNRTHIQIHIGNWVKNSVGCILLGRSFKLDPGKEPMITSSGDTVKAFLKDVPSKGVIRIK